MEIWDAYNENLEKVGKDLIRGEKVPEGLFHLVSHATIKNHNDDYLLMRRDYNKPVFPGLEELGAGGSALKGETPLDCIKREVFEETGIKPETITELFCHVDKSCSTIFFEYLVTTDCDKDSVILQEGETVGYRWISSAEVIPFLESDECIFMQRIRLKPYFDSLLGGDK